MNFLPTLPRAQAVHTWLLAGLALIYALVIAISPAHAQGASAAKSAGPSGTGPLVTPQWLDRQLKGSAVLVLDASMPHQFAAGRIPGAVSASVFGQIGWDQNLARVQRRFQALGLNAEQTVVVYDEGASWMAARLFHDLHIHGFPLERLYLLDGGLHAWKAFGGELAKGPSAPPATGSFVVTQRLPGARADLAGVFTASGNTQQFALIDALEPESYFGAAGFFDRIGHIPSAKNWPVSDFFDPATKRFKPTAEIERMAGHLGVKKEQTAVVYCGGGGAAAVPNFALRYLLGRANTQLYNESLREWLADPRELPIATYPDAQRLRSATWLEGWNTPLLRAVGYAHMNVIDLRTKAQYDRGHIPHAIHLPASVFREHLNKPEQLNGVLASAGVQPAHRMVLVSEAGLSPDAALAALLLERAGATQVSLLTESTDNWGFAGRALAKPAASTSTPPKAAAPSFKAPGTVRFVSLSAPLADKVVVNFGKPAPAAGGATPQVHVPYTTLLDAKGNLKPAKDLWVTLNKAGVPRYASLIATAPDAADAAVGYFALQLMGYRQTEVALPD